MKAELRAFSGILAAQYRAAKNYLSHRLDRITKIELAIFFSAVSYDLFSRQIAHLSSLIGKGKLDEVCRLYGGVSKSLLIILFLSGVARTRKKLGNPQFSLLLAQPLSDATLAAAKLLNLLLPFLLLLPLWLIVPLIFYVMLSVSWYGILLQVLFQTAIYLAFVLLGMGVSLLIGERRGSGGKSRRLVSMTFLLAFATIGLVRLWPQDAPLRMGLIALTVAVTFLVLSHAFVYHSLVTRFLFSPDTLWQASPRRRTGRGFGFLMSAYLCPVPRKLTPLVHKDMLFAVRSYKTFLAIFMAFLLAILGAILRSGEGRDAAQWLLFLSIAASYFLANAAFKFNEEGIERLQVIRSHPVSAKQHWWSKFWVGFLPCLWLILTGHLALAVRHFPGWIGMLQSLVLSLFAAVTLIFVENNFALYSYPYARYAPLWYNLYIITAAAFFTILLFPPLAVAFLFFGYYAIFRVQRRMTAVEVLS